MPGGRVAAFVVLLALLACPTVAAQRFRLAVRDDGVYGLGYEDLAAAGLIGQPPSAGLALRQGGAPVPIWVEDGGDGRLGPGDRIEWIGRHLAGTSTYRNPHSATNFYVLATEEPAGARLRVPRSVPAVGRVRVLARQHRERDILLLRLAGAGGPADELWYWAKLTHADAEPFRESLDLGDLDPCADRPLRVRLRLRGWSRAPHGLPGTADHRVEVLLDGRLLGSGEWSNGQGPFDLELAPVAASDITPGPHELALRVPQRSGIGGDPLVDVVALDWIELGYPRRAVLRRGQDRFAVSGKGGIVLSTQEGTTVVLYGDDGTRAVGRRGVGSDFELATEAGIDDELFAVVDDELLRPASIALDAPSRWKDSLQGADYLAIGPADLLPELGPLLELRRSQGLSVASVDVQDVYDEFGHGIAHPRALRDFIAYAYHHWRRPAPRFVLLVGDASWDSGEAPDAANYPDAVFSPGHGPAFAHIAGTAYPPEQRTNRNRIPTWSAQTDDGHAASDNWLVAVDGDDNLPEMAVGRLAVSDPAEVAAIVDKIVRHELAPLDAWRSRVVLISNEDPQFQRLSERLSAIAAESGYSVRRIYASPERPPAGQEPAAIRESFDEGALLVHFIGHGGRFIWRTGPPDWTQHRDLFNLADVERLVAHDRLPLVLAMTCYSAPFDHPTEDSIGEKLLREPGRGAVAVIAASWRNAPTYERSAALLRALLQELTVGEALARAKRETGDPDLLTQYNLLGDPALRLRRPPPALASAESPRNVVRWATASERDNFGYDVYRATSPDGPFARLTPTPVLGVGTSDVPQNYEFVDHQVDPSWTYYYYVESISLGGERERFTPVIEAQPKQGHPTP